MIIWGSKARKSDVRQGQFFCPRCQDHRGYTLVAWKRWFTLYFIPLFPTETLQEHVACQACRGEFVPTVLNYSREQILAASQPWSCLACSNTNPANGDACIACGHGRDQPVAAANA